MVCVSIMNVKRDMRCFWLVGLRVVGLNYFKSVDLQLVCLAMDYITWLSMNVNRDTVNDFSLIGRFEVFESNMTQD